MEMGAFLLEGCKGPCHHGRSSTLSRRLVPSSTYKGSCVENLVFSLPFRYIQSSITRRYTKSYTITSRNMVGMSKSKGTTAAAASGTSPGLWPGMQNEGVPY